MATNYPYFSPYPDGSQNPGMYQPQTPRQQFMAPQQIGIKGRPVSSIEEARATSIDFDGSIFYFPDIANKKIYTKQINIDGTSTLSVYEYKEIPTEPVVNPSQFVTKEEFETALNEIKGALQQKKSEPVVVKPQASTPVQAETPQFNF